MINQSQKSDTHYFKLTINILIKIRAKVARYDVDVLLCATYERYAHK